MRHDLHVDGHAFRLRPVSESDAAYIVELRKHAGPFLNRGAQSVAEQREWLEHYFLREDDFYFVVETVDGAEREGLVALYGVRASDRSAEWGRWALRKGSNAAIESALLVYRCAFEQLQLQRVWCRTLVANAQAIAFHDSCGVARTPGAVIISHHGEPRAGIEHSLTRADWPVVMTHLDALASRFAARRDRSRLRTRTS